MDADALARYWSYDADSGQTGHPFRLALNSSAGTGTVPPVAHRWGLPPASRESRFRPKAAASRPGFSARLCIRLLAGRGEDKLQQEQ